MSDANSERRKTPRADAKLRVELTGSGLGAKSDAGITVASLNIGAGGVYVEVPHYIEPLTKLSIGMSIPGPTAGEEPVFVETEAIVVRTIPERPSDEVERYEIACAFLALADEDRDAIHRYILTHRGAGSPSG